MKQAEHTIIRKIALHRPSVTTSARTTAALNLRLHTALTVTRSSRNDFACGWCFYCSGGVVAMD